MQEIARIVASNTARIDLPMSLRSEPYMESKYTEALINHLYIWDIRHQRLSMSAVFSINHHS